MTTKTDNIAITLNGDTCECAAGRSLADLLDDLNLDPRMVVVEHNRSIVRKPGLASTRLQSGDIVELVHFVGGG